MNRTTIISLTTVALLASGYPAFATPQKEDNNGTHNTNNTSQGQTSNNNNQQGQSQLGINKSDNDNNNNNRNRNNNNLGQSSDNENTNKNRSNSNSNQGQSSTNGNDNHIDGNNTSDNQNTQSTDVRNENGSVTGSTSSGSTSTSGSDVGVDASNIVEGISGVSVESSPSYNSTYESGGDLFLYLPDPVGLTSTNQTQPGMTLGCSNLQAQIDYIGGRSSSVSLYIFGFSNQKTPDKLPIGTENVVSAIVTCGLTDQIQKLTGENSLLSTAERAATERFVLDQLLGNMYKANGQIYNPRQLDLEGINRTPVPTIDSINAQ